MPFIHFPGRLRPAFGLLALALAAVALAAATSTGHAAAAKKHSGKQRLVVRGDAIVVDGPCDGSACRLELTDGRFRGTPVGTGAYAGSIKVRVGEAFPNGEGGNCAPLKSRIVLGAGTPNRLIIGVSGDSCQDGAGPLETTSFTGLAQFYVKRGTGSYAGVSGTGLAQFAEDAANNHRMTLIGRLAR
jgi:hypothetical protein